VRKPIGLEWPPDLAILDVVLSEMHGVDLAILLTQKLPNCRILLFSGQPIQRCENPGNLCFA